MKLEFSNSQAQRRIIGNPATYEEAMGIIKNFLKNHRYKSYYTRLTFLDDEIEIDVGSWSEFFYLSEIPENIKQQIYPKKGEM